MKKIKKCAVCNTNTYLELKYHFKKGDAYVCRKCNLGVFNGPMPKDAGADIDESSTFRSVKRLVLAYEFGHLKDQKNKKFIEIGSGSGELSKLLSEYGLNMTCNDVDRTSLKRIAHDYGIKTIYGFLEKVKIKKNTYDGVVMRHVFEHIDNPDIFIKQVHRIVKKSGTIYITQPNYDSLCRRIIGKNWSGYSVPSHRYYWSPKNISLFLKQNGFRVTVQKTIFSHYGLPLNLFFSIKNRALQYALFPFIFSFGTALEFLFVVIGKGQNLYIEAQKA